MTTRYRMTTDVRAWRIPESGELPDEAIEAMDGRASDPRHIVGERTDEEMARYEEMQPLAPDWPIPDRHYDFWSWYDYGTNSTQEAGAGDWVVHCEFGVVRMSDRQFREDCTEVTG